MDTSKVNPGDITLEVAEAYVRQFTANYQSRRRRKALPIVDVFFHEYSYTDQLAALREDEIQRLRDAAYHDWRQMMFGDAPELPEIILAQLLGTENAVEISNAKGPATCQEL